MRNVIILFLLCFLLVASSAFCTEYGTNKFVNPSFESGMDGWYLNICGNAKVTCDLDTAVHHSGKASIRLHSESPAAPYVYGDIYQHVTGLIPGARYLVTGYVKGDGVGISWLGGGPGWLTRKYFPTGKYDWTLVETEITVPDDATSYDLLIAIEETTQSLWLDDFSFKALDPADAFPKAKTITFEKSPAYGLWLMQHVAKAPVIDGNLSDWAEVKPVLNLPSEVGNNLVEGWKGADDLSVQAKAGWDDKNLYLSFTVTDDVQSAPPDIQAWTADSIQVAIDPLRQRTHGMYGAKDVEFTLALTDTGKSRMEITNTAAGNYTDVKFAASRTGSVTSYEIAIPFASLGIKPDSQWAGLGLSFLVNDNDKNGRKGYVELTPGIGLIKDPYQYVLLAPSDRAVLLLKPNSPQASQDDDYLIHALLYNPSKESSGKLQISTDGSKPKWAVSVGIPENKGNIYKISTAIPAGTLARGKSEIRAQAPAVNKKTSLEIVVSPSRETLRNDVKALKPMLEKAQKLAAVAKSKHIAIDYEDVVIATAEKFIGFALEDISNDRIERAVHVISVLNTELNSTIGALNDYLSGKRKPLVTPRFVTSPVAIKDGAFWATTVIPSTNHKEYRPVFFNGYGHYDTAIADIPVFSRLGCNIIQSEIGPNSTLPQENVLTNQPILDRLVPALASGAKNNVMMCWLTSLHYFPQWAFDKWPDIKADYGGFLKVSTDAPQARDIYRKHYEITLDAIRNSPALHSVCISNEPWCSGWETDKYRMALWTDYIKRIYGSIESLNKVVGTSFSAFDEVPVASTIKLPKEENMTALIYDQVKFNSERFAELHGYLSNLVHILSPGTPTHTKVVGYFITDRDNLVGGCDIEKFSWMGDLNGNDSYHMWTGWGDHYAAMWLAQNIYFDLQYSMRPVPIVNTENHIIWDREQGLIPPVHTDCALWTGAIHGEGASTIWIWERTNDRKSDFEGSILHRPDNVIAVGKVGLDLMRLAPEVIKMQKASTPIAILYSTTSHIWSERAYKAFFSAYEALFFTGQPVRFVSELQAARGGLSQYKVVILPAVRYLPDTAAAAVRQFAADGGKLWIMGDRELAKNEHGLVRNDTPLPGSAVLRFAEEMPVKELRDAFTSSMIKTGIKPIVVVRDPAGKNPWGVEYRSVSEGKSAMVSIVNYWGLPQTISLELNGRPVRRIFDMRASKYLAKGKLILQPLKAMLLRVE